MEIYLASKKNGKPPNPYPYRQPPWRIALIVNSRETFHRQPGDPADAGSEFDGPATIQAIAQALESDGHWVYVCEADHTLPEAAYKLRPHICFNIAEGLSGDGREAQVPALLELLGIPYTASRVVANAISLDKTQTKRIWQQFGLPTAPFWEFHSVEQLSDLDFSVLQFPLFIKPAREGSGMGIDSHSLVMDQETLVKRVTWALQSYQQPILVEEFLPGREFTVGFIGNPGYTNSRNNLVSYDTEGYHWFPILEIDAQSSTSPGIYGHSAKDLSIQAVGAPAYLCPADIPAALETQLLALAKQAAQAIGTCDVGRVDFRLDANGDPRLLEINTLPGLNPALSDLCIMAAADGLAYNVLIKEILYLAAERYGLSLQPVVSKVRAYTHHTNGNSGIAVPLELEAIRKYGPK